MATNTNTDTFTCSVCQKLYTDPVVHRLCGASFDRKCIKKRCPAQECDQIINESDLIVNHALLQIVNEHRLKIESPPAYYLILLDTSTSMGYSDGLIPFIGESRLTSAVGFLNGFFNHHLNSVTEKVSLVTFDTSPLQRFDFETVDTTHLTMLQSLTCEGRDTALFDSIDFCLQKLENLKTILNGQMPSLYLFILTDGGNNFGKEQFEHATKVIWRSRKLHISGHMIQIGDKNRKKTKSICDFMKYRFNHFNGGNVNEFVNSFTALVKTETRVQAIKTRSAAESTTLINYQFPDVPTEPVRMTLKQKTLA